MYAAGGCWRRSSPCGGVDLRNVGLMVWGFLGVIDVGGNANAVDLEGRREKISVTSKSSKRVLLGENMLS